MKRGERKKSQISVFVILGVVVLLGVIVVFYLINISSESTVSDAFSGLNIGPEIASVESYINDCGTLVSFDALTVIGRQGGYYEASGRFEDFGWTIVPYYYDQGEYLMPSKLEIENELSNYVDDNIVACLQSIDNRNFEFTYSDPKTTSLIENGKVTFNIDLDIGMRREGKSALVELTERPVILNSALFDILKVAEYITESHRENSEMLCLDCVEDLAEESDLYVDFVGFEEHSTLVIISENSTSIEPYTFEFLNKYTGLEKFIPTYDVVAEIPNPPEGIA